METKKKVLIGLGATILIGGFAFAEVGTSRTSTIDNTPSQTEEGTYQDNSYETTDPQPQVNHEEVTAPEPTPQPVATPKPAATVQPTPPPAETPPPSPQPVNPNTENTPPPSGSTPPPPPPS